MPLIDEKEILRRVELLSQIEPTSEALGRAMERVRQTLIDQEKRQKSSTARIWRPAVTSKITKFAAVAAIIIAVILGINYFGGLIDGTTAAFADVLEQIYNARTVAYKQTFYQAESPALTVEEMVTEPGYIRTVMSDGSISITDFTQGRKLQLFPERKEAFITQHTSRPRTMRLFNYLRWASELHEKSGEFVGQEELAGQMTNVFVAEEEFEKTTIWVDPKTNLPARMERVIAPHPDKNIIALKMFLSTRDFGGQDDESKTMAITIQSKWGIQEKMTIVVSDFVWNADLDELLFSIEPPEGYTVEERLFDASESGEKDLIKALAFWAEMSGGAFPSTINDLGDPDKAKPMLIKKFDRDGDPTEELEQALKVMNEILKGLMFAQERKVDGSWYYTGDGIQLGDADAAICWWKPEDSELYRVIYGDLSVGYLSEMPELQENE